MAQWMSESGSDEFTVRDRATAEQIATPEAMRRLETLAAGESGARLTREAAAVVDRVRKQ